jgi:hypothetical protein
MSSNTTEGIETCPHDERSTVLEAIESFVETTTEALAQSDAPESAVTAVQESGEELAQTVGETVARQSEEITELEAELKKERRTRAKEAAQDRKRITEVEERLDSVEKGDSGDDTPTPNTEETPSHEPETPLEEVVQLPEHLAEENLSANQQRARFVAKDIHEYSRSVQAGRVIKSSELRRVLTASEKGRVHTETVSRVLSFLDDLGQGDVKIRETQAGERVVVFTEEIVKRIVAYHNTNHSVVAHEEMEG